MKLGKYVFSIMNSRTSLNLGYVGSESRSQAQVINKIFFILATTFFVQSL